MAIHCKWQLAVALLFVGCTASSALSQPQPVPRLTVRPLDKASYVELAKEWKQYIDKNGETVTALVNLGMAYMYSEESDAAMNAAKRAVELGPDDPRALALMGRMLAIYVEDQDAALDILQRCREIAPDYEYGLTILATVYMRRGELAHADEVFKTMFDQKVIAVPLQDYAYNMLVGLPRGAVLVTGGDNDTFPPLALQAGMSFRRDVVVINRSLLNVKEYARALFEVHGSIKPDYDIEAHEAKYLSDGSVSLLSNQVIAKLIEEGKTAVYFAPSVNRKYFGFLPDFYIEGMNFRTTKEGLSEEDSARLFLDTYRLDSATDWSFAWALVPKVSQLMGNYVASMVKSVETGGITDRTKNGLLAEAYAIADFHELAEMSKHIESLREK